MTQQDVTLHTSAPQTAGHACGCAHDDEVPVLDVRAIPHAVRHGAVFGAIEATPAGGQLVLVAPHDPLPLLAQLRQRFALEVAYDQQGPDAWHVRLTRTA